MENGFEIIEDFSSSLTPKKIVEFLDLYIVGQSEAKKSVSIAVRNRWRRARVPKNLREDIIPANILMIGPTGVGKTEIARRLAKLLQAPFVKVEATQYTEIGYVGKNVSSMVRDLVNTAAGMIKNKISAEIRPLAETRAEEKILDIMLPISKPVILGGDSSTRENLRKLLKKKELDEREIEIPISSSAGKPFIEVLSPAGMEDMGINFQDMIGNIKPRKRKMKKMKVKDAFEVICEEEMASILEEHDIGIEACRLAEEQGIIFIDEIDKITVSDENISKSGQDVSREGVQRDLLPLIEGTTVQTRYGAVKTDHILFIAAGAFNVSNPSDMIPEFQGRFPIRVILNDLKEDDYHRILKEPKNSLIIQYQELLKQDKVNLKFEEDSLKLLAKFAYELNRDSENIGARRLQTILNVVLEDILFNATEEPGEKIIDEDVVRGKLELVAKEEDSRKYIL